MGTPQVRTGRIAFVGMAIVALAACRDGGPSWTDIDARVVLGAHLSHGVGASPFDSPLVDDSVAADVILRARHCAAAESLAVGGQSGERLLDQLRGDGLLVTREGMFCTAFPIVVGAEREAYGALVGETAHALLEEFAPELSALLDTLDARGWRDWQYHFIWSQVFDSQVAWTELTRRRMVPPLDDLIAWVIFPDHPYRSGTNYYPDTELPDRWLTVTWRAGGVGTGDLVGPYWAELTDTAALIPAGETRRQLVERGLADTGGHVLLPVLREGDPLLDRVGAIASRLVDWLGNRLPLDALMAVTGRDPRYTTAMAYHDVGWEVLRLLVEAGTVGVPPALDRNVRTGTVVDMRGVAAVLPADTAFIALVRDAILGR